MLFRSAESAIGIKILLDDTVIFSTDHVKETIEFEHQISEDEGQHQLAFEMFGKTPEHTIVDDQGNLVTDTMLSISDITMDDISIDQVAYNTPVYGHDFNGSQEPINDQFYGDMGCNGTVRLAFTTPIYIWLLENL